MAKKRYDKPETKRAWNEKNKEKLLAQQRARRTKNIELTRANNRKWVEENPEKKKASDRNWQQKNRDRVRKNAMDWRAKNKGKVRARSKKWREENPEKMQAARLKWLAEHPEERKAYMAQYDKKNKDKISIKGRKRYRKIGPQILAKNKEWQKKNPHALKQISTKRRVRKLGATVGDTKAIEAWEKEWRAKESVECTYCHQMFPPKDCDSDHVIPLSRKELNPTHSLENLTISCWWCNRSKHNRTLEEWNAVKLQHPLAS